MTMTWLVQHLVPLIGIVVNCAAIVVVLLIMRRLPW